MSDTNEVTVKTIAILDLETNGLPQDHTCAITELSVYAFSATCLHGIGSTNVREPPELPRVLHKITMMIDPQKDIHPRASEVSGLTNEMLCNEAPFDQNAANCLLMFLDRLQKPICFVAHNGWTFDYPILDYVFKIINVAIPSSIYCVDSLKAFREFDEKQTEIGNVMSERNGSSSNGDVGQRCSNIKRTLFAQPFEPRSRYPPKGRFVLGGIFERVFRRPAEGLHRAEADVLALTQLVLHYGLVFLAYTNERKRSFDEVPQL